MCTSSFGYGQESSLSHYVTEKDDCLPHWLRREKENPAMLGSHYG